MTQKKQKFNAKKVEYDGYIFDSKVEKDFYIHLSEQVQSGKIKSFTTQPNYLLQPKFTKYNKNYREISYTPDFKIIENDDTIKLYDVKGMATQASELRKKLFDYQYPDIELIWITYVKKYGGWIDFESLKKKRKENKKI